MSVNVFPAPTSPIRKICKGFYVCVFSFYKISSTINFCSWFNFFIFEKNYSYDIRLSICSNELQIGVSMFFLGVLILESFSYAKSYCSISLALMFNVFMWGLVAKMITSSWETFSHPCKFLWIFEYSCNFYCKISHSLLYLLVGLKLYK